MIEIEIIIGHHIEVEVVVDQKKCLVKIKIDDDHDQGKTEKKTINKIQY
jgi:hypothetical protein